MVQALTEQAWTPDLQALTFEERLGLLVDREIAERQNRQIRNRLRQARLKQAAVADAILDRLVHHAHPLPLVGESLRKFQPPLTEEPIQE